MPKLVSLLFAWCQFFGCLIGQIYNFIYKIIIICKKRQLKSMNCLFVCLVILGIYYLFTLNLVTPSFMNDTIWLADASPAFRFASAVSAPIFLGDANTLVPNF